MKKRYFVQVAFCLALVAVLCFTELAPVLSLFDWHVNVASAATENVVDVQSEGVVRPEDLDEGLSIQSLDDIRGRRVTVRQPVMEVLDDKVPRQPTQTLSDTYQMLDFTTGEPLHDLAKINFAADPTRETGNKDHPRYPMAGLNRTPKDDKTGEVGEQLYFSEFEKYMLLRQAYYFNTNAMQIVNDGELKKHPAADFIYGKIPDDAFAVKMHIITDPIYRSPMTTGLYLAPGETVTVKISGLKAGESLTLYTHHQDTMGYLGSKEDGTGFGKMEDYLKYWDDKIIAEAERAKAANVQPNFTQFNYGLHGQWKWQNQKVPCMGTTFNIVGTGSEMEVKIGSMYGGPLYVKPTDSVVDMEITGAVLTPHFVLGVTTVEEFEKELRDAPGLIATLDTENGQLIGPAKDMAACDDIEKLAYFWHSVFAIDISLNGREYNYNMTMCYDLHVPAGEAVALNSNFCAQPNYWFPICMNYETLTTKGNWGTFHELGHVQAKTYGVNWGFCDGDGEVWNNTLIVLIYSMLCNMDTRLVSVEHGEFVHPYTAIERSQKVTKEYTDEDGNKQKITDYSQINEGAGEYFDQLSMYTTLLHSFGQDKFVDMFYTYKLNPAYCADKRADFVYRIALVDRVNIMEWVNDNYFANVKQSMFSESQWQFLTNLPTFVPVAYRWANGIDGHETARKYEVDGKFSTEFDLNGDNITSPKPVEIVSVGEAKKGHTEYNATTKKVTYTPPQDVTEYDSFDIIVKTYGGRQVTLNVNMKLLYRGTRVEVWDLGGKQNFNGRNPSVEQALSYVGERNPSYYEESGIAGRGDFNRSAMELLHMQFKFAASFDGVHEFYIRSDDAAKVTFYKQSSDGTNIGTLTTSKDMPNYLTNGHITADMKKGDMLFIDAYVVNWGGKGYLNVGVKFPNSDEVVDIPTENLLNPAVTAEELQKTEKFEGWKPRFVDSIKNATIDYQAENDGWKVLEAPQNESTNVKENILDGDENTIYHSKYNGDKPSLPHVFVIDTQRDGVFNYFEVLRRTNGNDKLLSFALYSCTESDYPNASQDGFDGWTPLFDGGTSNENAARQRISFPETELRYFKFVVKENSGHTVIREIYAGRQSLLNQTVKPSSFQTEGGNGGFTENSANGKLSVENKGAFFEFAFLGSGFDVYADTNPLYGSAKVIVDDEEKDIIDLSDKPIFNKCVYNSGELDVKPHTVRIITTDDKPFNISFINVVYGTPVAENEYPALKDNQGNEDFGDQNTARQFTREWRTYVKDYKQITSIKFLHDIPQGYDDTYVRIDTYIRLYRSGSNIAFVYPGKILAPIECGSLFAGCSALSEIVLDNFDTSLMRGAMSMFYDCSSLTDIDLSEMETNNTLSFGTMFGNCSDLKQVDMSHFRLDGKANLYKMFENCSDLETIQLPNAFDGNVSCELPYVYHDTTDNTYSYKLELNSHTAGHVLQLHKQHTFDESHTYEFVAPTCTNTGKIAYKTCSVCHCDFDYQTGSALLKPADLIVPATGHHSELEYEGGIANWATCTKPGCGYLWRCTVCGEVTERGDASPALGHWYVIDKTMADEKGYTVEYRKDGTALVTVYLVCQSYSDWETETPCEHKTVATITLNYDMHQEATCTECESYYFDTVIDEDALLAAINVGNKINDDVYFPSLVIRDAVQIGESLGHEMQYVAAIPATCEADGSTSGMLCARCGHTEGFEATPMLGHKMEYMSAVKPTCTAQGHTDGTVCVRCGKLESALPIDALGHEFTVDVAAVQPTCTKVGHTAGKKCVRCDAVEGCDVIEDLGHKEEIVKGRPATETESGLTDGKRCSVCGEILEEQRTIPALGSGNGLSTVAIVFIGLGVAVPASAVVATLIIVIKKRRR